MDNFVLDTNLFFNMEADLGLGKKTEEVTINLTKIIKILKKEKKADFFMPPKAVDEYLSFFPACRQVGEEKDRLFIKEFLSVITVKSPDITKINFPASIFYKLVGDIRARSYRGLNIA